MVKEQDLVEVALQATGRKVRGRVYSKGRGYDLGIEQLIGTEEHPQYVNVKGADDIVKGTLVVLEVKDLTVEERLRYAFMTADRWHGKRSLFSDTTDRYNTREGEGVGWEWQKAEEVGQPGWNSEHEGLTLYLDTYDSPFPLVAVDIYREFERGNTDRFVPDGEAETEDHWLDTYGIQVRAMNGHTDDWGRTYGLELGISGLTPEEAISSGFGVLNTLRSVEEAVTARAEKRKEREMQKVIYDLLNPVQAGLLKVFGRGLSA